MNIEFLAEAEEDLTDAVLWYEAQQAGLGYRFKREVEAVTALIAASPLLYREWDGGYRRVDCPVFPYYIPYFIVGNTAFIAAVAHEHRRPGYFEDRTS
jgi:plasmid stabilization system protein ParE